MALRLVGAAVFLLIPCVAAMRKLHVPEFSYTSHPMYTQRRFAGFKPAPVIMKRYVIHGSVKKTTYNMMFSVGRASYVALGSSKLFASGLDVLYAGAQSKNIESRAQHMEVELNGAARVFLIMETRKMTEQDLQQFRRVSGLDKRWKMPGAIKTATGEALHVGSKSRGLTYSLPRIAAVVERLLADGEKLILPSPRTLKLNGNLEVVRYCLLFARPGVLGSRPVPFKYPKSPSFVASLDGSKRVSVSPVLPNEQCPEWLHDLYRTQTRLGGADSRRSWRTWHPMIDPIYWCYFGHEHGSHPGKYVPRFDYTAFKTPDNTTPDGRQRETEEGFKVFTLPLHTQRRYVIFTVHMHASISRRFTTRHHTLIFAVLDEDWTLEMELHMKLDFGFAGARLQNGTEIPMGEKEASIMREVVGRGGQALRSRIFNVLNLDDFPRNVDPRFALRDGTELLRQNEAKISGGIYERWSAPLNQCSSSALGHPMSFTFDFRNVATGKRHIGDKASAPMQVLSGNSVDRRIIVPHLFGNLIIGTEHCHFSGRQAPAGVFYTDPYFNKIVRRPRKFAVRHFIKPGFQDVSFEPGEYTPIDPWAGPYEHHPTRTPRRHDSIERAVLKGVN